MKPDMHGIRTFGATHRYYQGPGALGLVGDIVNDLGRQPLLVADEIVHALIAPTLVHSLATHRLPLATVRVIGEVTRPSVQALVALARADGRHPDVVLAAGGGKGVDTGKALARELGARLVVLPTAASNDGPCSRLFVYYDNQHRLESVKRLRRNPDAVVVDTLLLVKAPRALLVAGIGDALSKLYEGEQARGVGGLNSYGGRNTLAAAQLCLACDQVIRDNAVAGLAALTTGVPNEAFECLTEGLILLSGLAFENSGLSVAHSLTRGLSLVPGTDRSAHGYHVGYGLLVQWALERRSDDFLTAQLSFYRQVGLAATLCELGAINNSTATLRCIAEGSMGAPNMRHFERHLEAADVVTAMARVEALAATFPADDRSRLPT
jgi:glycerol dehydrogenase